MLKSILQKQSYVAENPFQYDYLDRKAEIKNLTTILESIQESHVLSINGQWGSGKTTFVHLWKQYLENKGYYTFYFNAWENDSAEDPLIALIGEIEEQITSINTNTDLKKTLHKIRLSTGKVLKATLPTLIKIASHGLLDIKVDDTIKGDITEYLSSLPSEYIKYKKERECLRKNLIDFADSLPNIESGQKIKIVFFIDELDRCKPTFAINLLEKVKHIFNLPNYTFILALDKEQLGYSIKTQYGNEMDTEGYLRRFIDFNYNLDNSKVLNFIPQLFTNLGYSGIFQGQYLNSSREQYFLEMLKAYCKGYNLSLREIEQLFFNLKIILPNINCEVLHNLYTIPLLLIIRIKNFPLYSDYMHRKIDVSEILDYFQKNRELEAFFISRSMDKIKIKVTEYLKLIVAFSHEEVESLKQYFIEQKELEEYNTIIYDELLNILEHPNQKRFLEEIRNAIEFTMRLSN